MFHAEFLGVECFFWHNLCSHNEIEEQGDGQKGGPEPKRPVCGKHLESDTLVVSFLLTLRKESLIDVVIFDEVQVLLDITERTDKDTREVESEAKELDEGEIALCGGSLLEFGKGTAIAVVFREDEAITPGPQGTCQTQSHEHARKRPVERVLKILIQVAHDLSVGLVEHGDGQEDVGGVLGRNEPHDGKAVQEHAKDVEGLQAVHHKQGRHADDRQQMPRRRSADEVVDRTQQIEHHQNDTKKSSRTHHTQRFTASSSKEQQGTKKKERISKKRQSFNRF